MEFEGNGLGVVGLEAGDSHKSTSATAATTHINSNEDKEDHQYQLIDIGDSDLSTKEASEMLVPTSNSAHDSGDDDDDDAMVKIEPEDEDSHVEDAVSSSVPNLMSEFQPTVNEDDVLLATATNNSPAIDTTQSTAVATPQEQPSASSNSDLLDLMKAEETNEEGITTSTVTIPTTTMTTPDQPTSPPTFEIPEAKLVDDFKTFIPAESSAPELQSPKMEKLANDNFEEAVSGSSLKSEKEETAPPNRVTATGFDADSTSAASDDRPVKMPKATTITASSKARSSNSCSAGI